jgi:hypothetical protein
VRTRAVIRRWHHRQRNLASGVWFRLRRSLASARAAYVIPDDEARGLIDDGYAVEPCGRELAPEKTLVFVDERRLSAIAARREIAVNLGPEFLAARSIALVPFDGTKDDTRIGPPRP